jgi:hypothetical protein
MAPVAFTSLVAPVLVNMIMMATKRADSALVRCDHLNSAKCSAPIDSSGAAMNSEAARTQSLANGEGHGTKSQPVEITRIIVRGAGKSPQDALQDALRNGLARAIAAQVGPDAWTKYGQVLLGKVLADSGGLIRSWTEIGTSKELRLRGTLHHIEVAVDVDHHALAARVRSTFIAIQP